MNASLRQAPASDNVPAELKTMKSWVCWRFELERDANGKERWTKVLYNPIINSKASATNPGTWNSFTDCVSRVGSYDGIGYVLSADDPYVCIDLDNKERDPAKDAEFAKIIDYCDTYTEVSPSGLGAHIWLRVQGVKQFTGRRGRGIEAYASKRFITFTGNAIRKPNTIEVRDQQLVAILAHIDAGRPDRSRDVESDQSQPQSAADDEILKRLATGVNSPTFLALWNNIGWEAHINGADKSASSADMALMNILWSHSRNAEQTLRLMWASALKREKWTKNKDYLGRTLRAAMKPLPALPAPQIDGIAEWDAHFTALRLSGGTTAANGPALATRGFPATAPNTAGIVAKPFVWVDPERIPPREWVYGNHYIRRFVSATVAPGATGKTALIIVEGLAMASGRNLIGHMPSDVARVWLHNGEDPHAELQRRITAAMLHHNLTPQEVEGRLYVTSGRDARISIASRTPNGTIIDRPIVDAIKHQIRTKQIDVMIVDPFVSSHNVNENDNDAIDAVVKEWAGIADAMNCSIELVHHTRKANGVEAGVDHSRGASAFVDAARSVRVLNVMTTDEATKAGVDVARSHIKVVDGKPNMTPASDRAWWYRITNVMLPNGPNGVGDHVGVVESWRWPSDSNIIFDEDRCAIRNIMAGSEWRDSVQAGNWVGHAIGAALRLDTNTEKARIKAIIAKLKSDGFLTVVMKNDATRQLRPYVEIAGPNLFSGSDAPLPPAGPKFGGV